MNVCYSIGERYEEQKENRKAIPWYKIALEYGFKDNRRVDRETIIKVLYSKNVWRQHCSILDYRRT
jgi:hypothetical protein